MLREGAIAAVLTALMIVLFLGSWRSTLIVVISIPLSILSSLVVLYFLGDTINTMTLGGLALAVGILVDNSTVTIENTHRLLTEERMPLPSATLHGAAEIAVPTLVSTLAISCVFISVLFLHGPAKYLFTPLGLAVVFAMLASYGLSRTLTPITIGLLLKGEHHGDSRPAKRLVRPRLHARFEHGFEAMRHGYTEILHGLLTRTADRAGRGRGHPGARRRAVHVRRPRLLPAHRWRPDPAARARAGRHPHREDRADFSGDRGQDPRGHPGATSGTTSSTTSVCRRAIYNLAFADGTAIGVNDGVILVALKEGHRADRRATSASCAQALPAAFPEEIFYFQAADMVTQILNFGIPAQIDVRTVGYDRANEPARSPRSCSERIAAIPGIADVHMQQEVERPEFLPRSTAPAPPSSASPSTASRPTSISA